MAAAPSRAFIGRAAELTALVDSLDAAVGGRTAAVLVGGEPGIGKTRLLEEFTRLVESRSVPVLWGRATSDEGAPTFWPWRQILRQWLADTDPGAAGTWLTEPAAELARIAPEFAALVDAAAPPAVIDAQQRFALFETVAQFLAGAAVEAGLVVVLDDLHWADTASLRLLAHVVRHARHARLLLVGAFRPLEMDRSGAAGEIVAELGAQPSASRVEVIGLSADEVGEQLAHVLGRPPTAEVAATVARRTAGNPLFVQEVGRLLATGAQGVPAAVRTAIGQRLAYLHPDSRRLLAAAAVVGVDINVSLLAAVTGLDIDAVMGNLDGPLRLGLVVRPHPSVGYRFAHDLIRDCCALDASGTERARTHLAVAEHLERAAGYEQIPEIAHHRVAALPLGDARAASDAAARAAERAMTQLAYEDAARLYDSALGAASAAGVNPGGRARLLVERARALHLANDEAGAVVACDQAAALAQQADDAEALGRAALVLEDTTELEWLAKVGGWCQAALTGLEDEDSPLRAQLLAQLSMTRLATGDAARLDIESAEALAMAERVDDDPLALATALRARQLARSSPDGVYERLVLADRMEALGTRTADPRRIMWGHLWRFDALVGLGRIDDAEAELRRLEPVVAQMRQPLARWHLVRGQATIHIGRGRFSDALAATEQAKALALQGGHGRGALFVSWVTQLLVAGYTGEDVIDPDAFLPENAEKGWGPVAYTVVAEWYLFSGRQDEVEKRYQRFPQSIWSPPPFLRITIAAVRAVLAAAVGDRDGADVAYRSLSPYADLHVTGGAGAVITRGSVQHYLGVAAAGCERLDRAVDHLRTAVAANSSSGLPPCAAESQCRLAETLLARDARGDRDEAVAAATEAKAIADRLGMRFVAARADAVLAKLRHAGTGPLSRREHEIAGLVADGLTNRQIAARLHIAERTAENHVQHILTKLGFHTRSQIATWWTVHHGLPSEAPSGVQR